MGVVHYDAQHSVAGCVVVMETFVAAVDIGASSGRVLVGCLNRQNRLTIEEVHRFENGFVERDGHDCWDVDNLFAQIETGLEKILSRGVALSSVAVDTWGVDFVLVDGEGKMLGQPVAYRDKRTDGVMEEVFKVIPREELFARTGIAFMQFNTIYQLFALLKESPAWLEQAETLLLMPDYLHYRLSGAMSCEYTNATTSQLVSLQTKTWDREILDKLAIPAHWFQPLTQPGSQVGEWTSRSGARVKVITPASHDTAAAVLATPLVDENSLYISSGTWSLIGIESEKSYGDAAVMAASFTNEGGVDGTYRILKNVMGLWLVQRLRDAAPELSFADIVRQAEQARPFSYLINPNDTRFLNPASMKEEIAAFCRETGQGEPQTFGEFARCVYESLAFAYRQALDALSSLSGRQYQRIHVVGGGSQNRFLCQLTADLCRVPVHTGPIEASALGNMTSQLRALGLLKDRRAIRDLIRANFSGDVLTPDAALADRVTPHWDRYKTLCG